MPGEDYPVTVKRALVEGLRYSCPKCVENYGVAGLPDAFYEKHRKERGQPAEDGVWYDDDG